MIQREQLSNLGILSGFVLFWSMILAFQNLLFPHYTPFSAALIAIAFFGSVLRKVSSKWLAWILSSLGIGGLTYVLSILFCFLLQNSFSVSTRNLIGSIYCSSLDARHHFFVFLGFSGMLLLILLQILREIAQGKEVAIEASQIRIYYILLFFLLILPIILTLVGAWNNTPVT